MPRLAPGIHVVDGGADPKYAGLRPKELRNSGAARSRQVRDEAAADRVGSGRENQGHGSRLPQLAALNICPLTARPLFAAADQGTRDIPRGAERELLAASIIPTLIS